jgi:hypothetical protein
VKASKKEDMKDNKKIETVDLTISDSDEDEEVKRQVEIITPPNIKTCDSPKERSLANSPSIITLDSPSPPSSPVDSASSAPLPPLQQPPVTYPTIVNSALPDRPFVMQIRIPPESRYHPY